MWSIGTKAFRSLVRGAFCWVVSAAASAALRVLPRYLPWLRRDALHPSAPDTTHIARLNQCFPRTEHARRPHGVHGAKDTFPQCSTSLFGTGCLRDETGVACLRQLRLKTLAGLKGSTVGSTPKVDVRMDTEDQTMCFEFEYLYWAKLEEEARQRKEEEEARRQSAQGKPPQQPQPEQRQPIPV